MRVRDATPEEAAAIFHQEGIETWIGVLTQGEGHICLSRGPHGVFGHNTTFTDAAGALALWRAGKRKLSEWGTSEYFVHLEIGTPQRIADFWMGHAKPAFVVLRGEI